MSIVRWNPNREMDDLFSRFNDAGRNVWGEHIAASDWTPAVDVRETDADFRIDIDLPEVASDDVNVSVKDGVLAVTGERKYEKETQGKVHRIERRYGRFTRSFRLPENADETAVEAHAKDGVLHLTVPKQEELKPRAIEVEVR